MPFINAKLTTKLTDPEKEGLKADFAAAAAVLHKSENWIMVEIEDEKDIWFGGTKRDKAAYVNLQLVGALSGDMAQGFSQQVCTFFEDKYGIPKDAVYITMQPFEGSHWGWNGSTF